MNGCLALQWCRCWDVGMEIEFSGTIAGRIDRKEGFSEEVACEKILMPWQEFGEVKKWAEKHQTRFKIEKKKFFFLLEYSCFIKLYLLYSTVNQFHMYIYPLFLISFPLGHHRALSKGSLAIQQVFINYLFYIWQCLYVNFNFPMYCPLFPSW